MKISIIKISPFFDKNNIRKSINTLKKLKKEYKNRTISKLINLVEQDKVIFNIDSIIFHNYMNNHEIAYILYILGIKKGEALTPSGPKLFYSENHYEEELRIFFEEKELLNSLNIKENIFIEEALLDFETLKKAFKERTFFGKYKFTIKHIKIRILRNHLYKANLIISGSKSKWKKEAFLIYTRHIGLKRSINSFTHLYL